MQTEFIIQLGLLGIIVGFAAGLLGVGGGGILVPMLTSMFLSASIVPSHAIHLALGTSMASIIVTSFSSMREHQRHNTINWNIVKLMSIGVLIGTFSSTFLASYLSSFYLALFFAIFMGYVALKVLFKKRDNIISSSNNKRSLLIASTGIGAISAFWANYLLWEQPLH